MPQAPKSTQRAYNARVDQNESPKTSSSIDISKSRKRAAQVLQYKKVFEAARAAADAQLRPCIVLVENGKLTAEGIRRGLKLA